MRNVIVYCSMCNFGICDLMVCFVVFMCFALSRCIDKDSSTSVGMTEKWMRFLDYARNDGKVDEILRRHSGWHYNS